VERWRAITSMICGIAAGVFLVAMMLLTVVDVTLRAAFNMPVRATYELIELLLACTIFLALPAVFLRDEHIVVEIIDNLAPRRVGALKRAAEILAVIILTVMAWQGWRSAIDAYEFNDMTADLGLPRILHWAALLAGVIAAGVAAFAMAIRRNVGR
jgi:TRAP-type C4-dicarboxylate transport system permease small subunit